MFLVSPASPAVKKAVYRIREYLRFYVLWMSFSRMVKALVLAVAVVLSTALFAFASENIRVAIADNQRTVTVKSVSGLIFSNSQSKKMIFTPAQVGNTPVRISSSGTYIEMNGKSYRGTIELIRKRNGLLQVINELDVEDYLKGVVAAEIPHDWEFEALKAQTVAARTYALYQKRTTGSRPYHILATVGSQVYDGKRGERPNAVRAIEQTKDLVLVYDGEVIPAFYHSSCGGRTENAVEVWGIDAPYLQGVDCECQTISQYGIWEKRISLASVASILAGQGYRLKGIQNAGINGVTPAGRVRQVVIGHADGIASIPAEKFRAAIGYSAIPSVFFEIEIDGREMVISGRGLGHGVGLCQWGAREMAQRAFDYRSILYYYYPGTRLVTIEAHQFGRR